jgi:hypothetical protein
MPEKIPGIFCDSAAARIARLTTLMGLLVQAIWHVTWADPVAALAITPFIAIEARESLCGKACGCC